MRRALILLVALAVFFWTLKTPWARDHLRGTLIVLIFAYVVRFGAQAMGAAQVAVAAVPSRLSEAGRILGAGPLRRLRTIDLPLMMPGLLAGGGLVVLSFLPDAERVLDGDGSPWSGWSVFWLGMGLALVAAVMALRRRA